MTLQATFAATLADEWVRAGVTDAVVSPGSRSTPLVLALAARPEVRLHVVLDERSAGFFALGLGHAAARPAVVVTTSGTAAVEVHPAVVEAHEGRVPMIVCTADRPAHLHQVGSPQTVAQHRLFGDAVRWSMEPGVAEGVPRSAWRSIASRAVAEAVANVAGPGPVHLNLAFRDPLVADAGELPPPREDGRPWHVAQRAPGAPGRELASELHGRRGVIVAGRRAGRTTLHHLAGALRWPVLADPRSQARGADGSVAAFDSLLRAPGFRLAGDVETVLRVGESPASKVLGEWLASTEAEQILVDPYGRWADPERRADLVVHADPTRFCGELMDAVHPGPAGWLEAWVAAEDAAQRAIDGVLGSRAEVTEPGTARALTRDLPDDVDLFVASSMPIRDVEWFGHPSSRHRVHANRGVNGIDGTVSTALGIAAARRGRPVVGLLGDLAFLYDAGGLLGAQRRDARCTLVVLDNSGGGIFSFLPQATTLPRDRFEALFATPQGVDIEAIASAYGAPVTTVDRADDVSPAVLGALDAGGVRVVRVPTDRWANVELHAALHAAVAEAVSP